MYVCILEKLDETPLFFLTDQTKPILINGSDTIHKRVKKKYEQNKADNRLIKGGN